MGVDDKQYDVDNFVFCQCLRLLQRRVEDQRRERARAAEERGQRLQTRMAAAASCQLEKARKDMEVRGPYD